MHFKKIYMHGFKSFAEPVTIEFHPGVTCIVGPNGSGKSNLSDAIRWVLGEQSAKSLRGGKMEDVIFNGTATRKSRGMAEVTLTIDNEEGDLPIEYNEVAITRRMYRSGESEYSINGNQCRLKDIRELIMDTGIGVDGYSLIGQGKISEIIENKTEGRRKIFEEAAGIVMYRTRKAEAERKLTGASGNLDRVNDIINEIEGRIDGLREDSEKASEYIELRERFKELEINITLKNVEGIDAKLDELNAELEEIKVLQEEKKALKEKASASLLEKKNRTYDLDEIAEETRQEVYRLIDEINDLVNRQQVESQKLESMEAEEKRISEERKDLIGRLENEKKNNQEAEDKLREGKELLEKTSLILKEKTDEYSKKAAAANETLAASEDAKSAMFDFVSLAKEKRAEAASYDGLKNAFRNRREQIDKEREASKESDYANALKEAEKNESDAQERLQEIRKKAEKLKEDYQQKAIEEKTLRRTLEDSKIENTQVQARKKTIEEMEANYEGYSNAVKFIMKQNMDGIYGTAAQLMTVPDGFETAVETALGGNVSNIICSDDGCAKKAVRVLKDANAGRLTFIPLESIKHRKGRFDGGKGFLGFASDIVSYDEEYAPAYEYLLGRTVIADTMDNAVALSKKGDQGLRFVTLDGEVISGAGTITGGRFRNRSANLLERKAEVQKLSERAAALSKKVSDTEDALAKIIGKLADMEDHLKDIDEEYRVAQLELNDRKNDLGNARADMKAFEEREEKWSRELADIEDKLSSSQEMINALIFEALNAEKDSREARVEAEKLYHEYEKKKELAEKASEGITEARMEATAAEAAMEGLKAIAENSRIQKEALETDISLKEKRLEEIEHEREESFKLRVSEGGAEEKSDKKAELEEKLELINKEKGSLKEEIDKLEEESRSYDDEISSLADRKISADIQSTRYETQLDNMKDKLWENFEISYIQAMEFKKDDFVLSRAVRENREIKSRMAELGDVNIGAIEEYAQVSERYEFLTSQRKDILDAMEVLKDIISEMDRTIRARFRDSFNQVAENFESVFKELFGGGYAELVLSDEDNPLESDIEIIAQPPEKKLQNINLLSGGEKTMTAIALMFAVLKAKPTPFCILDEVEAALDDDNMIRFAKYLANFDDIQFALITHQKTTMEYADVLYGVTMPERGISKVLSLKLGDSLPGLE